MKRKNCDKYEADEIDLENIDWEELQELSDNLQTKIYEQIKNPDDLSNLLEYERELTLREE